MHDFAFMESLQCLTHRNEDIPDNGLVHPAVTFLMFDYFLIQVTVIEVLHDYAQAARLVLKEGLFVTNYARMSEVKNDEC